VALLGNQYVSVRYASTPAAPPPVVEQPGASAGAGGVVAGEGAPAVAQPVATAAAPEPTVVYVDRVREVPTPVLVDRVREVVREVPVRVEVPVPAPPDPAVVEALAEARTAALLPQAVERRVADVLAERRAPVGETGPLVPLAALDEARAAAEVQTRLVAQLAADAAVDAALREQRATDAAERARAVADALAARDAQWQGVYAAGVGEAVAATVLSYEYST
jgi:hypothetical protein